MTVSSRKPRNARTAIEPNLECGIGHGRAACAIGNLTPKLPNSCRKGQTRSRLSDNVVAQAIDELVSDERFLSLLLAALEHKGLGTSSIAEDALVPLDVAKQISGLGKTMIYSLIRAGKFPPPYKPGGIATRWSLHELRAWKRALKSVR